MRINMNNPFKTFASSCMEDRMISHQFKMNKLIKKILHDNRDAIKKGNVIPYVRDNQIVFLK